MVTRPRSQRRPPREKIAAIDSTAPLIGDDDAARIVHGSHDDVFSVLGVHPSPDGWIVRTFAPDAERADLICADGTGLAMTRVHDDGLFAVLLNRRPDGYRIAPSRDGVSWQYDDPFRFGPRLGRLDEHLISEGTNHRLWQALGAHPTRHEDTDGTVFAVWAPNAQRVSVVGDFNGWDGRRHVMRHRGATGVWEIFAPGIGAGTAYMYEILDAGGSLLPLKADPVGFGAMPRPDTRSVVRALDDHVWTDTQWMITRGNRQSIDRPISIYEIHAGSWQRAEDGGWLGYRDLAERLVPYVRDMGFTHIEMLPLSEHPFDGSWGYQPTGLFAPTSRFGTVEDFRALVEACHAADIGFILDWVPGHFPTDSHGLGRFDGTPLYEYADPREGFHQDWNTLIYNFGRREVANFLTANALYWLKEHHVDGLRVDAVASMLYRDYSRKPGEWVPNIHGGRENLEAIDMLRSLNTLADGEDASIMNIAEESTAWPGVSQPVHEGGLGFGFKWNMGWMHDTLAYMAEDPMYRPHHHGKMSFGLHYAFSENFILPLSHDEVVHGKDSVLGKMPGGRTEKFANLRAYYTFMYAHPGKKLLFMGQEFAQATEWNHDTALPWNTLDDPLHRGVQSLVRDLNRLYREHPALHVRDCRPDGFEWLDGAAERDSVFAWLRHGEGDAPPVLAIFNFSGVEHRDWRLGVPHAGRWSEILNSSAESYGGWGGGNLGGVTTERVASHGRPHSIALTLPELSGLLFELQPGRA